MNVLRTKASVERIQSAKTNCRPTTAFVLKDSGPLLEAKNKILHVKVKFLLFS